MSRSTMSGLRPLATSAFLGLCTMGLLASGCGSRASNLADSGPGSDAGSDSLASGAWQLKPADPGTGPVVTLQPDSAAEGSTLWVAVRVSGVASLQGVAFRLTFDPQRVSVLASEQSAAWTTSSTPAVARFAVRPEGELWAGIGHLGRATLAVDNTDGLVVARIQLRIEGQGDTQLGFRPAHNMLLGAEGEAAQPSWIGGTLTRH